MQAELELQYLDHMEIETVEFRTMTELANIAYQRQLAGGYRTIRNILTGKISVVGLTIENVSFGRPIERFEDGSPAYGKEKKASNHAVTVHVSE